MGYRTVLEGNPETVQDLEFSAIQRLEEALDLYVAGKNHAAIYLAGLSAEMYLKTACFFLGGAAPADNVDALLASIRPGKRYTPSFTAEFESGHGLWFWAQELIDRRRKRGLRRQPNRFAQIAAALCLDWYVGMRYRPGMATPEPAGEFIARVEWLAKNYALLRR